MKNKINGIDVSECKKLGETIDGITCGLGKRIRFANEIITKHNLCKDNPDCYYKQLKRMQEENEKLKDRNANLRLNLATYDLPEIKKVLTDWRTGELDKKFKNLQEENEGLKKQLEFSRTHKTVLDAERIKYKQALEEIKEIANHEIKELTDSAIYGGRYFEIYNKINEVLNDRD